MIMSFDDIFDDVFNAKNPLNFAYYYNSPSTKREYKEKVKVITDNEYSLRVDDYAKQVVIYLNYCGCSKKDMKIEIDNNAIIKINATVSMKGKTDKDMPINTFTDYSKDTKIICNTDLLDISKATATMSEGLLHIAIPYLEKASTSRKIDII